MLWHDPKFSNVMDLIIQHAIRRASAHMTMCTPIGTCGAMCWRENVGSQHVFRLGEFIQTLIFLVTLCMNHRHIMPTRSSKHCHAYDTLIFLFSAQNSEI